MKVAERHVVFSDDAVHFSAPEHEKTESSDSEDEYYEITSTSEAESLATSDEEDAELLEVALDGAYSCSPSVFRSLRATRRKDLRYCCWTKTFCTAKVCN